MKIQFINKPVCSSQGEKVALSRRVNKNWRYVISKTKYID